MFAFFKRFSSFMLINSLAMKLSICFLIFFLPFFVQAQNITTIAGNGTQGYSGDNGPATMAQMYAPRDVAIDDSGNIYIADYLNRCIRKVNSLGIITTIAGGGNTNSDNIPATDASIYLMQIAVDKKGNLFIADVSSNRIRKVDTYGIIHTIAGTTMPGYNGDGILATSAMLSLPSGVAVDRIGRIYICDESNFRIRMIDTSGIIHTIAGTGVLGYSGDNGPATNAMLSGPGKIVVDEIGNVYYTDGQTLVRKVDTLGIITTIAGYYTLGYSGDGGPATAAILSGGEGIALDRNKNIYISDCSYGVVRVIDSFGIINTIAGHLMTTALGDGGPATSASLRSPFGVAVDTSGNLFIADYGHNRIRKVYKHTDNVLEVNKPINLQITPNPNNGLCYISFNTKQQFLDISVSDMLGRIVKQVHYKNTDKVEMSIEGPNGVYLVKINLENGTYNNVIEIKK